MDDRLRAHLELAELSDEEFVRRAYRFVLRRAPEPAEKAAAENEPTTPAAGGGGGAGQTVQVSEKEFKITLPSTTLKPGSYTFDLSNDGKIPHDLTIQGPGVSKAHTPVINGGQHATLKVKLSAGEYDFYCSVPGHKQLGMDVKVKVG